MKAAALSILVIISSAAIAALHPPIGLKPLIGKLTERRRVTIQELQPALKTIVYVEQQTGLRDANGALKRPHVFDPAVDTIPDELASDSSLIERRIARDLKSRREFDQDVVVRFQSLSEQDKDSYAKATRAYLAAQKHVRELSAEAITTAQVVYGIDQLPAGRILSGPPPGKAFGLSSYIGRQADGTPTFDETLARGVYGQTTNAAQIKIGPDAFEKPELLGSAIYHEGLHYKDYLTAGIDLRNVPADEVKVRKTVRPLLVRVFGFDRTEIKDHDALQASNSGFAAIWKRAIESGFDPYSRIESQVSRFPPPPASHVTLPAKRHFASLAAVLEEDNAARSDAKDAAMDILNDGIVSNQAIDQQVTASQSRETTGNSDTEANEDPQWDALHEWVETACRYLKPVDFVYSNAGSTTPDPDYTRWSVQENDRRASAKQTSDAADRDYLLTHSVVMEHAVLAARMKEHKKTLGSCERGILKALLAAPAPVQTEWLVEQLDFKKGGGSLGKIVRGINRGVKKDSAALVKGITIPLIAVGQVIQEMAKASEEAARENRRSQSNRPERPERPERSEPGSSRNDWNGSYAYGQLGGVASGHLLQ